MSNTGSSIEITQSGRVVMERSLDQRGDYSRIGQWEMTTFDLPPEALAKILQAVETGRVMELDRGYKLRDTFDGSSWTLSIRQGERAKAVGCSNYFPDDLVRFANNLDAVLAAHTRNVTWRPRP